MGLDDRIPLSRAGLEPVKPPDQAVIANASQPPIGCSYVDESGTYQTLTADTVTTLDFLATAASIEYDPYTMIDVTNNRVTIPTPGIWDLEWTVLAEGVSAATDVINCSFLQGTGTPTGLQQANDFWYPAAAADFGKLHVNKPYYVSKAKLNAGNLFYLRCLSSGSNNDVKIVSFTMWLRSAVIPGKY